MTDSVVSNFAALGATCAYVTVTVIGHGRTVFSNGSVPCFIAITIYIEAV